MKTPNISTSYKTIVEKQTANLQSGYSITLTIDAIMGKPERLIVEKNSYGPTTIDSFGDDDIDSLLMVEGDALLKMADKFQARDDKMLLKRLEEHFAPYGEQAYHKIRTFLEKKEIPFKKGKH